jgi:hypothetical protein
VLVLKAPQKPEAQPKRIVIGGEAPEPKAAA